MAANIWSPSGSTTPINVDGTLVIQEFTGAGSQQLFTLTSFSYVPNTGSLLVFVNGQLQWSGIDYTETSSTSFTLTEGVVAGDRVTALGFPEVNLTAVNAGSVTIGGSYTLQDFLDSQAINVMSYPYLAQNDGVTDDTAAIQAAIDEGYATLRAVYFPGGIGGYLCGNITVYPASTLFGDSRQVSNFKAKAGTSGVWWEGTSVGSSKLTLYRMAWYANNEAGITDILKAGKFGGAGSQYGTEGILADLWMRDAPLGTGCNVDGNVGILQNITVQDCLNGFKAIGAYNRGSNIITVGAKNGGISIQLTSGQWSGLEIEAPETGAVPLSVLGPASIDGIVISLDTSGATNFPALIVLDATVANEWSVVGLDIAPGLGVYTAVFSQGASTWNGVQGANFGQAFSKSHKIGVNTDARAVTECLSKAVSLDFPNVLANAFQDLTVAVPGAVSGNPVALGLPNTGPFAGLRYEAWVSAADTITVRANNFTAGPLNPGAQTFVVMTWAF